MLIGYTPGFNIGSLEHQVSCLWSMNEESDKFHSNDTDSRDVGHCFEKVGERLIHAWMCRCPGNVECSCKKDPRAS